MCGEQRLKKKKALSLQEAQSYTEVGRQTGLLVYHISGGDVADLDGFHRQPRAAARQLGRRLD